MPGNTALGATSSVAKSQHEPFFKSNLTMDFYQEINQPDDRIDLAKACLYFARTEYPSLAIEDYLNTLDTIAEELKERLPKNFYPLKIIGAINQYLFDDLGFSGNRNDYYDPRNSFLNEVIDRRTGIPISLSVVYLEVAKRLDFPMIGIGMPGHFLIRPNFEGAGIFIDVFNRGEILFEKDCEEKLGQIYRHPIKLKAEFLDPVDNRQILVRILRNLKFIYISNRQFDRALTTIEYILMLYPKQLREIRDRGLLYYQLSEWKKAYEDLTLYANSFPNDEDIQTIYQLLEKISSVLD